jgi:hypothetical protein
VYPTRRGKGDPNIQIALTAVVVAAISNVNSMLGERIDCTWTLVDAYQWKGRLPKKIHHDRLRNKYPDEISKADHISISHRHNAIDAIGIALWYITKERNNGQKAIDVQKEATD